MPEQSLWGAVLALLVDDAQVVINQLKYQAELFGCVSVHNRDSLDRYYHLLQTPWLHHVGDMAGIHVDHVFRHIQRLERKASVQHCTVLERIEFDQVVADGKSFHRKS